MFYAEIEHANRNYLLSANKIVTTSAKNVKPSIRAAAIIIVVLMSPLFSGCLAVLSRAALASLPIPKAAPITTKPDPRPDAKYERPKLSIVPPTETVF